LDFKSSLLLLSSMLLCKIPKIKVATLDILATRKDLDQQTLAKDHDWLKFGSYLVLS
jgi:hypothetical protein